VVVSICLAARSVADLAHAPVSPGPWRSDKAARKLLRPWRQCGDVMKLVTDEADGFGDEISTRSTSAGVELEVSNIGSGAWATASARTFHLVRGSCAAVGYSSYHAAMYPLYGIQPLALGGHPLPSLEEVREMWGSPRARIDDVAYAAARLYVQCGSDNGNVCDVHSEAGKLLGTAQPAQRGRPRGSPAGFWTPADLERVGVGKLSPEDDSGATQPPAALVTGDIGAPWLLRRSGRFELWELRFQARLGGGLLAVYDRQRDEHRWVVASMQDLQEPEFFPPGDHIEPKCQGHFHILSFTDREVVIEIQLHGDSKQRFAIDLHTGIVRGI